ITADRTFSVSGGTLNQQAGSIGGTGTLSFFQATANLTTDFSNTLTTLLVSSSTVNGPGTLTNASGKTLTLFSSTVNGALVNEGLLVGQADNAINGTYTSGTNSILRVQ